MAQNAREENEVKSKEWINDVLMPALKDWIQSNNVGEQPVIESVQPLERTLKVKHPWPYPYAYTDMNAETPKKTLKKVTYTIRLKATTEDVAGDIEFEVEGGTKQQESIADIMLWDEDQIIKDLKRRIAGI